MFSQPLLASYSNQRGVALIMVLGMVAIISAWASTSAYEDMISIRRISNLQDELRATMASESALALIQLYLQQDAKDTQIDSLEEDWALDLPPFPIDDGMISGVIVDTNRFYNLNDLVNDSGVIQPAHLEQAQRLFASVDLDYNLVYALADWLDKDNVPYNAFGAEDAMYYNKDYKTKNARLDNWQELKLIIGFNAAVLQALRAVATVRPSANNGKTSININTVSTETMMSLFPNMNTVDAETFFAARPFENTNNIQSEYWATEGDLSRLRVKSDAFMLRTHALFGRANVREEFLLSRTGQYVQLIWRQRLGWLQ